MRAITPEYYNQLFESCQIYDNLGCHTLARGISIYQSRYENSVAGINVPWVFVALVHCMECNCDMRHQILNGERWECRTRLVPIGRGPWPSWADSTKEALVEAVKTAWSKGIALPSEQWTLADLLEMLERWNGMGYVKYGINSPYLWASSQHYVQGKFIGDGIYSAHVVSKQIGAAVILRAMVDQGIWTPPAMAMPQLPQWTTQSYLAQTSITQPPALIRFNTKYVEYPETVRRLQEFLNTVLLRDQIKVDGHAGPKTSAAFKKVFGHYLEGDPR